MHPTRLSRHNLARLAPTAAPALALAVAALAWPAVATAEERADRPAVDFNRDIKPILSNACFACHGPDAEERKGVTKPFRLDTAEGVLEDLGGYAAVVPGDSEESELIRRVRSDDPLDAMPPPNSGKSLTPSEIERLADWVEQGAPYARHWAYEPPTRPEPPAVRDASWPRNPIDRFVLARLESEGLTPSPEADREALIRRVSLDLTGLPPTLDEVDAFLADDRADAFECLVDRLLAKPSYGEHWARLWLDLARYADSAGYADDPPRTIWAYRDYVIRSFNDNKPFDRFTIEQIAGDLLPGPTEDQLVATAFHRNTMTNNEGGTNDEEFRNVAVVDRVNTTMAVWMGTTMACAQCHDHKYDPLSNEEYFRLFAFLNTAKDADRTDESPTLSLYTTEQRQQKAAWEREQDELDREIRRATPDRLEGARAWADRLDSGPSWETLNPASVKARSGVGVTVRDDGSVRVAEAAKTDAFAVAAPAPIDRVAALRLEALPDDTLPNRGPGFDGGNFVVTRVTATITPPGAEPPRGRFVRVELPGSNKYLSLAEVEAYRGAENVARGGEARQSSTDYDGPARLAIDGNTDGDYNEAKSTTHTEQSDDPWWEVDLGAETPLDRVMVWNRTDGGLQSRLAEFRVVVLDAGRTPVWERTIEEAPDPKVELAITPARPIALAGAYADHSQAGFEAGSVLGKVKGGKGWAIGGQTGTEHTLTLVPEAPVEVPAGSTIEVAIEHDSKKGRQSLGRFRLGVSADDRAADWARLPRAIRSLLAKPGRDRSEEEQTKVVEHYLAAVAPETSEARARAESLRKELAELKPTTTVPILREQDPAERRKTFVQLRGNYQNLSQEVSPGVPSAFHPLPTDATPDRLALARWLVNPANPLTARVIANRTWEQVFGLGLVPTPEEFGSQGELPSHPELLDWLATELVANGWDLKAFLKVLVTSSTYRQSSRVTPELLKFDPDNRLLARGPRFRLPAETIRDQALAVAGLLSPKLFGPPVKPPQPSTGLNAAFGSMIDWKTSPGEDKYRRGIYTTWRRSNPYPSMSTFDAPSREVCTVKRNRTNTPLQALVTLNDPVYVEAAQALARRIAVRDGSTRDRAEHGIRLALARRPTCEELDILVALHDEARAEVADDPGRAKALATEPLGPAPEGADLADLAAWTVAANVLLNLDEMLMKR